MARNPAFAMIAAIILLWTATFASAQGGVTPAPTVTEEQGETTVSPDDGGFDWGWLGLLGLVGLAGLYGRRPGRERRPGE